MVECPRAASPLKVRLRLMRGLAQIGADSQPGAVGDVNAGLLARKAVDQHAERRKQARHEGNEAGVRGQIREAIAILLLDTMDPEVFEILEG